VASGIVESTGGQSEQQQQQQQKQAEPASRNKLVQRLLAAGSNLPAFISDLITTQAVVVAGTEAAAFLLEATGENDNSVHLKTIAHIRPDNSPAEVRQQALQAFQEIVTPCLEQNKNGAILIEGTEGGGEPQFCLVTLLRNEGNVVACSAVITRCRNQDAAQQRLMSMELVAGYFDLYTLRAQSVRYREVAQRNQDVLQYGSSVATAEGFESAGMNLCNELATRTGAARVSLGWVKGEKIKLKAMSHTEQFDRKQELSVMIEQVMEEALDQEEIVTFDPDGQSSQNVSREAQQLSRVNGGEQVMSLPLRNRGEIVGVMTLEYARDHKLEQHNATALAVSVELLGPWLNDRYDNDRWWITKTGIAIVDLWKMTVRPQHALAKLIILLVLGAVACLVFIKPMYHVAAPFTFDVTEKRTTSAPFQGVIEEVYRWAGDGKGPVHKGDKLLKLKTYDLEQQYIKALRDAAASDQKAKAAYADKDLSKQAEGAAAEKERDASLAQAAGIKYQIDQATVIAPIDGEILTGDFTDKIDSTVKVGDPLVVVGQPETMRCEIEVPERDIQMVREGKNGKIATAAMPTVSKAIIIDQIVEKAVPKEGTNTFTVYGKITDPIQTDWRPGMRGEARIDYEPRPLIWWWTHRLLDWVRLKVWM
jgi:multidrug resistance efflux pump